MNCIIVDDNALSTEIIVDYLSKTPYANLLKTYNDLIETLQKINFKEVDTISLDIDILNINGIKFIKNISEDIPIIFTSPHTKYTMENYELNVLDYLVKPFHLSRLLKSIEKLKIYLNKNKSISKAIFIKYDKKLLQFFFDNDFLLYIKNLKDYIHIVYSSLSRFMEELPKSHFLRIHKLYIVALQKIQALNRNCVEIGDKKIPVGQTYLSDLKKNISFNS